MRRWILTLIPLLLTITVWLTSYWWSTLITVGQVGIVFENAGMYYNANGLFRGRSFIHIEESPDSARLDIYEGSPIAPWQPIRSYGMRNKIYALALWYPPIMAALFMAWVKPWQKRVRRGEGHGFGVLPTTPPSDLQN